MINEELNTNKEQAMKTNVMKRAHEIKREAAKKFNCKESHIIFSLCLKMAWAEIKMGKKTEIGKKYYSWLQKMNGEDVYSAEVTVLEEKETAVKLLGLSSRDTSTSYWIKKSDSEVTSWGLKIRVKWFK